MTILTTTKNTETIDLRDKWRDLAALALSGLLAMTLWFSASAIAPQLFSEWNLQTAQQSWITMSVQLGFVIGAAISAIFNLADRIANKTLFAICALSAAAMNAIIPLAGTGFTFTVILRFATGMFLAGVYPPGMKLVATWCKYDRGLGIGLLVGALTIGSAVPHLVSGLSLFEGGMPNWRTVLYITSGQAVLASIIIYFLFRPGPYFQQSAPFNWKYSGVIFADKPTRLANFGYLGHMWELYAMWTWIPVFFIESYKTAGYSLQAAHIGAFAVIAIGAVGCVLGGSLADSFGRTTITTVSLIISGCCALFVGFLFASPVIATIVCLIWGFAVVADSAQFSAAISELSDPRYVGTALTVQTSLGFLLTLVSIRILPFLVRTLGWDYGFMMLTLGPAAGIWSMLSLRRLPEALKMAGGKR